MEPGTAHWYPHAYRAYRRAREHEERSPARHRTLGPDVDHQIWARERGRLDVDVVLTIRPDTPLRVRRIIGQVLLAIRAGRPAPEAIRRVARRFGLRDGRARSFIEAYIGYELRPRATAAVEESIGEVAI